MTNRRRSQRPRVESLLPVDEPDTGRMQVRPYPQEAAAVPEPAEVPSRGRVRLRRPLSLTRQARIEVGSFTKAR
jgi:hypothetical protein